MNNLISKISGLFKEKLVADFLLFALLFCQILILWFTCSPLMHSSVESTGGVVNMYDLEWRRARPMYLLLLVEILFLLNKKEVVFIPLRVIHFGLMTNFLSRHVSMAAQSNSNMEGINAVGNLMIGGLIDYLTDGYIRKYDWVDGGTITVMPAYKNIRAVSFLSLILLIAYVVFRFLKKQDVKRTPLVEGLTPAGVGTALAYDKLRTIAALVLIFSSLFKYVQRKTGGYLASLAVERGHFMLLTVFLGFLLLVMLANKKARSVRVVTIAILLTVLVWNPVFIFRKGGPGIGYILYVVSLVLLCVSLYQKGKSDTA